MEECRVIVNPPWSECLGGMKIEIIVLMKKVEGDWRIDIPTQECGMVGLSVHASPW